MTLREVSASSGVPLRSVERFAAAVTHGYLKQIRMLSALLEACGIEIGNAVLPSWKRNEMLKRSLKPGGKVPVSYMSQRQWRALNDRAKFLSRQT